MFADVLEGWSRRLVIASSLSLVCACGRVGYEPERRDGSVDAPIDAGCTATRPADYCAEAPALERAPVIDGTVDCELALQPIAPAGWYSVGDVPIPAGVAARYAAAWRADGLYVYLEVDDPAVFPAVETHGMIWCGDAPEIYVDSDGVFATEAYDDPGTRQLIARPAATSFGDVYADTTLLADWTGGFVVALRPGGYALEAFVDAADLALASWSLAAGSRVGLDLSVNVSTEDGSVSTDCGHRLGQFFLRVGSSGADSCNHRPYCNAQAFCTPMLVP